jgi:hypothetical protein
MATGWPIEARLQLVRELYLVIGNNQRIKDATNPKADSYWITRAILFDEVYATDNRCTLIKVLKKSPIWEKLQPFLKNSDTSCARKGCSAREEHHIAGRCIGTWCGTWPRPADFQCACKEFIPKKL